MRDFIIVTPQYKPNSNGIKTMHKLCHSINSLGGTARLVFIASNDPSCQDFVLHDASWTNPEWNTPPVRESEKHLIADSYVIYPEVVIGNPLGTKYPVRFFGNREGYCNGKKVGIGPNDFLLAHSRATRADAHYILFNSEVNPVFHDQGALPAAQRTLDATYVGKGYLYGEVKLIDNTLLIGRDWPINQQQLALLLRQVKCFYTWDSWTSTNLEAIFCGAVPFILRYDPWTSADIDSSELGRIPRLDFQNPQFDPVRFEEERRALRARIDALSASWPQRVQGFMSAVARHFEERVVVAS